MLDKVGKLDQLDLLSLRVDQAIEALGRVESRQLSGERGPLERHEFRVYSHAGEDGIIQFLVHNIPVPSRTFIEFGVEDYREANTRFLLSKDHWTGLVMDGSEANIERVRADPLYWNSSLTALATFVTRENVNEVITSAGFEGDLGLLSVDVDGNDYWIFDAISMVQPAIAVVEYNHRHGPTRSTTIAYDPGFVRRQTDASWLWSGASLKALVLAAERKSLAFVGCNSFGNNAFFVREDLLPAWLPRLTAEEGYVRGRFRESLVVDGVERVLTDVEEGELLSQVNVVDVS
jgi:hypothetical protein